MSAVPPTPSDEMDRFSFDGAEGIAFWIDFDAEPEDRKSTIMHDDLPTLLAFLRHNFPGLFDPTKEDVERAAKAMWVAQQDDRAWAESVVDDVFSPADDWPEECVDLATLAHAALSAVHPEVTW
jgi:hypothetical protein